MTRRGIRPVSARHAVAAMSLAALVAPALAACAAPGQPQAGQPAAQAAPQGIAVSTIKVARDTLVSNASYGGSIQPKAQVSILPRTAGRIISLPVEIGSRVKAGDMLAELDHTTIDAQVAQARANVNNSLAALALAQSRLQTILAGAKWEDVAVTEAQVEAARIRVAQAMAGVRAEDVRSAESAVVSAQARLDAAQTGPRIEDILAGQAQVDTARNRLNQVLAAGRVEDVRAAEATLAAARARLQQLENPLPPRQEDVLAARAAWDQAKVRLAQVLDSGTGQGVTARPRAEDIATLELRVQRAQAAVDKAIADRQKLPTSGAGASTVQQLDLAVTQAQLDLRIAQNDLLKARQTGPTDWEVRVLEVAEQTAKANYEKVLNVAPSTPSDLAAARSAVDTAVANIEKLKSVTPFDIEAAQQALNQAEANLAKVKNPDQTSAVAQAQAALDQAVAALDKARTPSQFDIDAAQAALTQAEASLASRKNQFSEFDRRGAEASVAQAQAAVEQQQAALAIQQANLAEAFVRAPFDGIISERAVSEGSVVAANTTLMTLMSNETDIALNVEEAHIARFQESAPATFTVNAFPGEQFKGMVTSVFPSADPRSRTFTVKVKPEDQDGRLRPGMFAQLVVTLERRENVNVIPREAIVLRNDRPFVFTVGDNAAVLKQVELGMQDDRRAEVRTGLQTGEDIVVSGQATLRDKDTVRVIPVGGARPQGGQAGGQGAGAPAGGGQGAPAGQGAAAGGQQGAAGAQGTPGAQGQRPQGTPGAGGQAPQGGQQAPRPGG